MERITIAVAVLAMGLATAAWGDGMTRKGYELPPYTVERAEDAREIRAYGPRLVAEVTVRGDRSSAINTGFRVLAGYIFGGNATGEKIAMTVPVDQAAQEGGLWTVRFTMPSRFETETLPVPEDTRIRLVQLPASRMVVETFGGLPDSDDMAARAATLKDWAAAQGMQTSELPVYSFYDAPWTPPWSRRNEVAFLLP